MFTYTMTPEITADIERFEQTAKQLDVVTTLGRGYVSIHSMNASSHMLEDLLGGLGRIAVLRVLVGATGPLTGRQIAERAGLSHAGAMRVLDRLVARGIVSRTPVGRAMLHVLVADRAEVSTIIAPLFAAEEALAYTATPVATDPVSAAVNPHVRRSLPAIAQACRDHHVSRASLFGSATQVAADVVPRDLDLLVTFEPLEPRMKAEEYEALVQELERIMGMPVDVMVSSALRNARLREEIERTEVVLYAVA